MCGIIGIFGNCTAIIANGKREFADNLTYIGTVFRNHFDFLSGDFLSFHGITRARGFLRIGTRRMGRAVLRTFG
jgi:hypothetical protein